MGIWIGGKINCSGACTIIGHVESVGGIDASGKVKIKNTTAGKPHSLNLGKVKSATKLTLKGILFPSE
jgi:hypothetical protein